MATNGAPENWDDEVQLETKVIRMFPKISQSRRRPLLGPLLVESGYYRFHI